MTSPADQADQIALAAGPAHTRADWEKIAAGVLRKSHKLAADDPDSDVWDRLTWTTLDGIDVAPLGTADLVADLQTSGRPDRAGEWDVRTLRMSRSGPDLRVAV